MTAGPPCKKGPQKERAYPVTIKRGNGNPPFVHDWWFRTVFYFAIQLGMSSSQLTNSIIFQRGRYATNQIHDVTIYTTNCGGFLLPPVIGGLMEI